VRSFKQLQQLNLRRAQIDQRRLQFRLILHALQLDAVQIDLGDIAGMKAVAADLDDLVVVLQIVLRQLDAQPWPAASARRPRAD
jgi:hypothetical protein